MQHSMKNRNRLHNIIALEFDVFIRYWFDIFFNVNQTLIKHVQSYHKDVTFHQHFQRTWHLRSRRRIITETVWKHYMPLHETFSNMFTISWPQMCKTGLNWYYMSSFSIVFKYRCRRRAISMLLQHLVVNNCIIIAGLFWVHSALTSPPLNLSIFSIVDYYMLKYPLKCTFA